ncbi:MAG: pyridoxamine 5'-phosphate oxidase family protein [Nocardioides sp.]
MTDSRLSPTARTTITRHRERGAADRGHLFEILDEALVCHVGVVRDGAPVVLPSIHAADPDGPDEGGTLYLHGSVAAPWLAGADGTDVCVTVTLVDGIVAARSAFNHSMNYRSALVLGRARRVTDDAERAHALGLVVDHIIPGRGETLRANTHKELAATAVLAVPLAEASAKVRGGGPVDDAEDVAAGVWAGVIPLHQGAGAVEPDLPHTDGLAIPDAVRRRAAGWGAPEADR